MARSIQRDRDLETFHRGMQYRRAIQLYYRKFHAYPPNVDALVNTNDIRFLRKKYIDPMTGKDDWKPIVVRPEQNSHRHGILRPAARRQCVHARRHRPQRRGRRLARITNRGQCFLQRHLVGFQLTL